MQEARAARTICLVMETFVDLGTLDARAAAFLRASVIGALNLVVCGGTQAGKTTLLNCLAAAIPGWRTEVFEHLANTHRGARPRRA